MVCTPARTLLRDRPAIPKALIWPDRICAPLAAIELNIMDTSYGQKIRNTRGHIVCSNGLIGVRFQLITHGLCLVSYGLDQGADDVDLVLRLPALGLGAGLATVAVNAVVLIWKLARMDF